MTIKERVQKKFFDMLLARSLKSLGCETLEEAAEMIGAALAEEAKELKGEDNE